MNHLPLVILVDAEEVVVNNAKVPWHDGWAKRKTYELVGCKVVNSACIAIRRLWFMCDNFQVYSSLLLSRYFGSWLKLYGDFCNVTVSTDRSATENTQSVGAGALRVTCASL